METLENLLQRLSQLERDIVETKKRLPAHSVKPPVMMDLLALEDEYEEIRGQIERIRKAQDGRAS